MKKLILSVLGMSVLMLGSCSREYPTDETKIPDGKLKLTIEVADISGAGNNTRVNTRAGVVSQEGENTIGSLYLLFFDQQSDRSGEYLDYTEVAMPTDSDAGTMGMSVETTIDFPAGLTADGAYNILAIANIGDGSYSGDKTVAQWMSQWAGKSERDVMANSLGVLPQDISPAGLLMHGRMEKAEGEEQARLILSRDLARLDVTNAAKATYDLVTVSVWNAYPTTSIFGDGMMDYSADVQRVRRHYGVSSNEGADIKGGLYAFENMVSAPEANDNVSTCLIIGMRPTTGTDDAVTYYRVNMLNSMGAQQLRRNYAYNLTIQGVSGAGAPTEEIAYLGQSNKLIYTIGDWSLDMNGLTIEDDYSVLSIPTKTINMGKNGQQYEFKIHTFSSLPSPAPLTVRSQTYSPASELSGEGESATLVKGINARLDGNTLVVESTTLGLDETERHGVIVLSFAGLELSMNVSQSGTHDDFLIVSEPDGGITPFAAYAGIASGLINVQASGDWTARLYMSGFSFNASTALSEVKVLQSKEGSSTSSLIIPDTNDATISKFRVYTHSANTGQVPREAFIVVELDKDPENYSSVIMLSQNFIKQMYLWLPGTYPLGGLSAEGDPVQDQGRKTTATATFNGQGTALEAGIPDNSDTFIIGSPLDDGKITPWYSILVADGLTDDTAQFQIIQGETSPSDALYDREQHKVQVKAKGINISGRSYKAIMRAQVDPGTYVDINLVQVPVAWNLPAVLPSAIAAIGGDSQELTLDAPAGMHYTVEIESISGTTNHFAYVKDPDDTTGTMYSKLLAKETTKPFVVGFPKLIYPNLYGPATATVKVTLVESGESKTFTVSQNAPAQKTVNLFNIGQDWGGVSNNTNKRSFTYVASTTTSDTNFITSGGSWYSYYNGAWSRHFHTPSNFGNAANSMVKITTLTTGLASTSNANFADIWESLNASTTIVHYTRPGYYTNANASLWSWVQGEGDYAGNEGVLVVNAEDSNTYNPFGTNRIPTLIGLTGDYLASHGWKLSTAENRVMDYLTKSGPFGAANMSGTWTSAVTSNYMNISSIEAIEGAVPVLVGQAGSASAARSSLMIDPKRRIVVKTDSEMFEQNSEMLGFGQNLQAWIVNTAQYGTHFSEYFWDSPRYLMTAPVPQQQQ
jgi:hypothetical protein